MKMDANTKKAISRNRVRILALDYLDLSAPMLATESLPLKKHKEIKSSAISSKERVDLLLEWVDESAPIEAFPSFIQGIRNCGENVLAKKIKKEATDGIDYSKQPPTKKFLKVPSTPAQSTSAISVGLQAAAAAGVLFKPKGKPKDKEKSSKDKDGKPKPKKSLKGDSAAGVKSVPFNGLDLDAVFPLVTDPAAAASGPKSTPSRKRKSTNDAGTGDENTTSASSAADTTKVVSKPAPKSGAKKPANPKIKFPKTEPATPRISRKSSSDKAEKDSTAKVQKSPAPPSTGKGAKKGSKAAGASENQASDNGSPAKSPKGAGKAKVMTFKDVEKKQLDSRQKFRFRNSNAAVKVVHFKDKTDISYLGCPFEENNRLCEKKVELKSKEFVCESKHKSPNCKHIPRLLITCNDGTADLQLTLMKQNVELFSGKSSVELGALSVNDIKDALDSTLSKKLSVEVLCEKTKKGAKKSAVMKWTNLATILSDDGAPPAKKKKKN